MERHGGMEKYGVLNEEFGVIELTEVDKFLEDLENGDIIVGGHCTKEDEEAISAYFQARKAQREAAVA